MRGSRMYQTERGRLSTPISKCILMALCCFAFYVLGAWQKGGTGRGDSIAERVTRETECTILPNLQFETHHSKGQFNPLVDKVNIFEPCHVKYADYTPCQDVERAGTFPTENMIHRERHCPLRSEKLRCLIPAPKGYLTPFQWPRSRELVPFANVPQKSLTVSRADQNWVQYGEDLFKFSEENMHLQGIGAYIDEIASVIPIADGTVRTALDIGCGAASWGAHLFNRNVLAMSFAPRDSQEAQVQFALERGVPATIGVLGTVKLPYPSRAFDMVHCSSCSVPWTSKEGMYLMEVDRILRPGGYWILSALPINWNAHHEDWGRSKEDLNQEQKSIESFAEMLCWEKKYEKGDTAIWQKLESEKKCNNVRRISATICRAKEADDVWYKRMEACITRTRFQRNQDEEGGGGLKKFPERLHAIPPRITHDLVAGVTKEIYEEDNTLWKKHVKSYKRVNKLIGSARYRNIMDMNAGFGSFAAAIESPKSWVMNVVPSLSTRNTLGIIYERGLIGIYHDWCEAFSTYPRTYDLIHCSGIFSLYQNKCDMADILLEMDRILRPEGSVILRDNVDVLNRVRRVVGGMRWKTKMLDHEDGPMVAEKILIAVKEYWVGTGDF